jgi:hypothetical protein
MRRLSDKQERNLMNSPTDLYRQLLSFMSQHSHYRDFRHLKTLAWMVSALVGSQKLSLPE